MKTILNLNFTAFTIFILLIAANINAQTHGNSDEKDSSLQLGDYLCHLGSGLENSFDDAEWLIGAGAIALLSTFDDDVQQKYNGKLLPNRASRIGDYYGHGLNFVLASGFIFTNGLSNSDSKREMCENLQIVTEAYVITIGITYALKYITHRQRPNGSNYHSLPSGHTSSSFAIAASMNHLYGWRVGAPTYALAILTGISRINDNQHYLSDVLAGALLGTLVGCGFATLDEDDDLEIHGGIDGSAWVIGIKLKL